MWCKTKINQKLPAYLDDKLLEFQRFIIEKWKKFEYELSEIGNIDETPVFFDMVRNLTIEECCKVFIIHFLIKV